jgi:hypothetical protein
VIKFALKTLIFVTFSVSAWAQAQGSSGSSSASADSLGAGVSRGSNTGVIIDIGAIINKGFGIGFTRNLSDHVAGQVHYSKQTLEDEEGDDDISASLGSYSSEHRAEEYGARLDYFFNSVYRSGFYVGAGIKQINLETQVDPIFSDNKTTLKDEVLGAQGYAGYFFRTGASAIKVGLGYGAGGSYSNNLGGTKNEIKDGLLLDLAFGIVF